MRLEIEPTSGLADETPSVKVINGPPQSEVMIIVAATDAKDHRWESRNVFRTDPTGTVDISREAPASGSYGSVDPAGPIWSMRFASEDLAPSMFAAPRDQLEFAFTAEAGGETASGVGVRRWSGPGVTRSEIRFEQEPDEPVAPNLRAGDAWSTPTTNPNPARGLASGLGGEGELQLVPRCCEHRRCDVLAGEPHRPDRSGRIDGSIASRHWSLA